MPSVVWLFLFSIESVLYIDTSERTLGRGGTQCAVHVHSALVICSAVAKRGVVVHQWCMVRSALVHVSCVHRSEESENIII